MIHPRGGGGKEGRRGSSLSLLSISQRAISCSALLGTVCQGRLARHAPVCLPDDSLISNTDGLARRKVSLQKKLPRNIYNVGNDFTSAFGTEATLCFISSRRSSRPPTMETPRSRCLLRLVHSFQCHWREGKEREGGN